MTAPRLAPWLVALVLSSSGCRGGTELAPASAFEAEPVQQLEIEGVAIDVITGGEGAAIEEGSVVKLYFRVLLPDGEAVDDNHDGDPLSFVVGGSTGGVIEGLHLAVEGARAGELRVATIPPRLAYRGRRVGKIPGDADLVFQLQIVAVR